jgi:hypothetical protein
MQEQINQSVPQNAESKIRLGLSGKLTYGVIALGANGEGWTI